MKSSESRKNHIAARKTALKDGQVPGVYKGDNRHIQNALIRQVKFIFINRIKLILSQVKKLRTWLFVNSELLFFFSN